MGNKRQVIEDRFDIMPLAEIAQRLLPYRSTRGGNTKHKLGWATIARHVGIYQAIPRLLCSGNYESHIQRIPKHRMSDQKQRLLSRVLRQLETGELSYAHGAWTRQAATRPATAIRRLVLVGQPVVQLQTVQTAETLPSFTSLFGSHEKPGLPKSFLSGKQKI